MAIERKTALEIATALCNGRPKRAGNGWMIPCPSPGHPDKNPSCKIWDTPGGYIGARCFSRCKGDEPKQGLADLGYIPDWEKIKAAKKEKKDPKKLTSEFAGKWIYTTLTGETHLEVRRYDLYDDLGRFRGKEFGQFTANGKPPTKNPDYTPLPYNLPALKEAADNGAVLFDVEGESCAEALKERDFTSTTYPGGGKNNEAFLSAAPWQYVQNAAFIVVLDDNDVPGLETAKFKAWQYHKHGKKVKLIHLPGLGERTESGGRDVRDWFVMYGHKPEELRELVLAAPFWEPEGDEEKKELEKEEKAKVIELFKQGQDRSLTETFAAEVFLKTHGDKILFVRDDEKVRLWDGQRFKLDPGSHDSWKLIQECNDKVLPGALTAQKVDPNDKRKYLKQMLDKAKIGNVLAIVCKHSSAYFDELDQDPELLCVKNGIVNLRTGEFKPVHDPKLKMTRQAAFNYKPGAQCPEFMEFQSRIFQGDEDLMAFNCRWRGYGLTGKVGAQKVRINRGDGANGKSVDMNLARRISGDYGISVKSRMFMKKHDNQENQLDSFIQLVGIRGCYIGEVAKDAVLADDKIKEASGGDELQYRVYFQTEPKSFFPQAKLEFRTNYRPTATTDDALWRRLMVVDYNAKFSDKEKVEDYDLILFKSEADAIGSYYVQGAIEYFRDGLMIPDSIELASARYRQEDDLVWQFVSQWFEKDPYGRAEMRKIYQYFKRWSKGEGYEKQMAPKTLKKELERLGFKPAPDDPTIVTGLRIKPTVAYNNEGEDDERDD